MKKQYIWINKIKLLACLLVVAGHFFTSMILCNIMETNIFWEWFLKTIYYFHVPLFFICSGYLYQNGYKITNLKEWKKNIAKKAIALGVPYILFSSITIIMKVMAADSVNNKAPNFINTLLFDPIAPYWFLYILFFMFVFTKNYQSKKNMIVSSIIAFVAKILIISVQQTKLYDILPYFIKGLAINEIWFVIGMNSRYLCEPDELLEKCKNWQKFSSVFIIAMIISITIVCFNICNQIIYFIDGMLFCYSFIGLAIYFSKYKMDKIELFLSKYTLSIFLMHTIFAAGVRIILIKLGIVNIFIHIFVGLMASIILPIIAEEIMKKSKLLYFWIYPNKVLNRKAEKTE